MQVSILYGSCKGQSGVAVESAAPDSNDGMPYWAVRLIGGRLRDFAMDQLAPGVKPSAVSVTKDTNEAPTTTRCDCIEGVSQ